MIEYKDNKQLYKINYIDSSNEFIRLISGKMTHDRTVCEVAIDILKQNDNNKVYFNINGEFIA